MTRIVVLAFLLALAGCPDGKPKLDTAKIAAEWKAKNGDVVAKKAAALRKVGEMLKKLPPAKPGMEPVDLADPLPVLETKDGPAWNLVIEDERQLDDITKKPDGFPRFKLPFKTPNIIWAPVQLTEQGKVGKFDHLWEPSHQERMAKEIRQLRYVLVLRRLEFRAAQADHAKKEFRGGFAVVDAQLFDLEGPKHLGGFGFGARSSEKVQPTKLQRDLEDALETQLKTVFAKVFPKIGGMKEYISGWKPEGQRSLDYAAWHGLVGGKRPPRKE